MSGAIAKFVGNYDDPQSIGSKLRRKRSAPLLQLIDECFRTKGSVELIDVGGMEKYWNICGADWLAERRVRVTLLNLPDDLPPIARPDVFREREGDGCELTFEDGAFDICHSNSTIEHVGSWQRKKAFAAAVRRIARAYFIQTPNFWFPWEPHFGVPVYHWLPEPVKLWLAGRVALGWHDRAEDVGAGMEQVEYASLLSKSMIEYLFPDADIISEKCLFLTKSFVALRRPG